MKSRDLKNGLGIAAVILLFTACESQSKWQQAVTEAKRKQTSELVGFELKTRKGGKKCKSIVSTKNMVFTLDKNFKPDQSIKLSIKFTPEKGRSAFVDFLTGCAKERLRLNVRYGVDIIHWYSYNKLGKNKKTSRKRWDYTKYSFNAFAKRNFSWTDELSQWTEHYSAQNKPLEEIWFELKYIIRKNRCQVYLDGILLDEWQPDKTLFAKRLEIKTSKNIRIKTALVSNIPPENNLYQPVNIAKRLNARGIDNKLLAADALPPAGEQVVIKSIPFEFPQANEQGQDNIDIGQSWFRCAKLKGGFSSRNGTFGGRWAGASSANPTRIQFRIPKRQYNAVYIVAAADSADNSVPKITVQFYRPYSGFPKNFESPKVPAFSASSSGAVKLAVKTKDGSRSNLWLIKIPVEPGKLQEFSDLNYIEFELSKPVKLYRCYPDPCYYSAHGAGLPSSVRVFAMTLGIAPVSVDFNPDRYANVWTSPETPSYTVKLRNRSKHVEDVELTLKTKSFDGKETIIRKKTVSLQAGKKTAEHFKLNIKRFGWHSVNLQVKYGQEVETYERSLAFLRHADRKAKNYNDDGFIFGFWNWLGQHHTPTANDALRIIGPAGAGAMTSGIYEPWADAESFKLAAKYGIKNYLYFGSGDSKYMSYRYSKRYFGIDYKQNDPQLMQRLLLEKLQKKYQRKSNISEPTLLRVFAEPGGIGTHGTLPELYGEPEHQMTQAEKEKFEFYKKRFLVSVKAVKAKYPNAKILMPHGDPTFTVPFLKENGEVAKLIDGVAVDIGFFERLPEQQFHQCSIHRMKQFTDYWKKYKKTKPLMATFEGPCIAPVRAGALSEEEVAAHTIRAALLLGAYGVNRQFATASVFDCASYWGEQHYGGGLLSRINSLNPHVVYAVYATMSRHLKKLSFKAWIPTGSLSVYCLQFKNNATGKYAYILWTLRGKRKVIMQVPAKAKIRSFDCMDNDASLTNTNGKVEFTLAQMPLFIYGAGKQIKIQLGASDHSDSKLGKHYKALGNCGKIAWKQVQEKDRSYTDSFLECIRRFPAEMQIKTVAAPANVGGKALTVKLTPQSKNRGVMPFYTTLYPDNSIVIPGKAEYLSMWVKAASDWGRVVYVLRDAKGEKWISVGSKNQWNSDDTHGWSKFCYDGWRLLKFELPAHAPYDNYRENGTTWWGSSEGDEIVDLPLRIEKIMIERRPLAMYVNSLEKTNPQAVELADIYAEYASALDMTEKVVQESKIRMPKPGKEFKRLNPVAELAAKATLPPSSISSVKQPEYYYDGTRGIFSFKEMPQALTYDIWLSRNPDGTGAIKLGSRLGKSGVLVRGFLANTDFYAFIVYYDRKGNVSKPSAPFKFRLKDMFAMK